MLKAYQNNAHSPYALVLKTQQVGASSGRMLKYHFALANRVQREVPFHAWEIIIYFHDM